MGAGDSSRPDRPSTGLLLNATRGSALRALPLFFPSGAPGLLNRQRRVSLGPCAGRVAVVRPTGAPFRAGALPLLLGRVSGPLSGAASLAKPARRSLPRLVQTGSGIPSAGCSRACSAARGKRQQSGRSSTRCGSETGSEPAACRPCHAGSPGTPAHARPPRSSGPGVSARSLLRPGPHAGRARTRSAAPAAVLAP